jgi:hypothetical protein
VGTGPATVPVILAVAVAALAVGQLLLVERR